MAVSEKKKGDYCKSDWNNDFGDLLGDLVMKGCVAIATSKRGVCLQFTVGRGIVVRNIIFKTIIVINYMQTCKLIIIILYNTI